MDNMQGINSANNMQPNYMCCAGDNNNSCMVCNNCMNDPDDPVCYGEGSMKYAPNLLEFIYAEYSDYRYYMNMYEKCRCMEKKRIFKAIADDEFRHSNLFMSAYFLITGKRFSPSTNHRAENTCRESLPECLRERYFEELGGSQEYANFAKDVDDDCLKQLLMEISEDEKEHSMMIMDIITKICACDLHS